MKKYLLFVFAILLFKLSAGQISKDNWLVGGHFAFTHYKQKTASVGISGLSEVQGDLNAGYLFIDKLAAGVRTSIQISRYKLRQADNSTTAFIQRVYGIGPFIRYYILAPKKMVNFFGDAGFLYNLHSNEGHSFVTRSLSSSLAGGAVVFLNQYIGLEGILSYTDNTVLNADAEYNNTVQFKLGLQVHLGKKD